MGTRQRKISQVLTPRMTRILACWDTSRGRRADGNVSCDSTTERIDGGGRDAWMFEIKREGEHSGHVHTWWTTTRAWAPPQNSAVLTLLGTRAINTHFCAWVQGLDLVLGHGHRARILGWGPWKNDVFTLVPSDNSVCSGTKCEHGLIR